MKKNQDEEVLKLFKEFLKDNETIITVRPRGELSLISITGATIQMFRTISRNKAVLLKEWLKDE